MEFQRLILVILALTLPVTSFADVLKDLSAGNTGEIHFDSATPISLSSLLKVGAGNSAVQAWGNLSLPPKGADKVPAVIYLHHSGGYAGSEQPLWLNKFSQWGIAFFPINTFRPRGMNETNASSVPSQILDALRALKLLSTHPRIDANKIIVMGTSLGGLSSFEAMIEPIRSREAGNLSFAAGIGIYSAPCAIRYLNVERSKTPFLWLAAEKEDWTDLGQCKAYVEHANANSGKVRMVTLPGAYHGFDQTYQIFNGNFKNLLGCNVEVDVRAGTTKRGDNGHVFSNVDEIMRYLGSCGGARASLVSDTGAVAVAEREIKLFLNQTIGISIP